MRHRILKSNFLAQRVVDDGFAVMLLHFLVMFVVYKSRLSALERILARGFAPPFNDALSAVSTDYNFLNVRFSTSTRGTAFNSFTMIR